MEIIFDKYELRGAYHERWLTDLNFPWYRQCVDKIVAFCQGSTLDAGAGEGVVAERIKANGYSVLAIDNNSTALNLLAKKGIPFENIDLESAVLPSGNYEYMACLNTIEHLKSPIGLLNLFDKVVTKAAIIITDEPTDNLGTYHHHEYTQRELKDLFANYKTRNFKLNSNEFGHPVTFIGIKVYK